MCLNTFHSYTPRMSVLSLQEHHYIFTECCFSTRCAWIHCQSDISWEKPVLKQNFILKKFLSTPNQVSPVLHRTTQFFRNPKKPRPNYNLPWSESNQRSLFKSITWINTKWTLTINSSYMKRGREGAAQWCSPWLKARVEHSGIFSFSPSATISSCEGWRWQLPYWACCLILIFFCPSGGSNSILMLF